jgi:pyrroline-5-carboxylate reductase
MRLKERIGIIGVGRMGEALAKCLVAANLVEPGALTVSDKEEGRLANLALDGVRKVKTNEEVTGASDAVVIAVKPADAAATLREIRTSIEGKLVISIAAGLPTDWISALVPGARIIRVMPNTPALLREGASAYCLGPQATEDDGHLVESILSAVGVSYRVEEKLMDAVTGLSGSGPAYFYQAIDAMAKEGAQQGIPAEVALKLAAQTAVGAGKMVLETGKNPEELTAMVASPGGTTVEGLRVLSERRIKEAFADAVKAATERSKKLGEQQQNKLK